MVPVLHLACYLPVIFPSYYQHEKLNGICQYHNCSSYATAIRHREYILVVAVRRGHQTLSVAVLVITPYLLPIETRFH